MIAPNILTGETKWECAECSWTMTLPEIGVRAAELATAAHPDHVIVRVSEPAKRRRRAR